MINVLIPEGNKVAIELLSGCMYPNVSVLRTNSPFSQT